MTMTQPPNHTERKILYDITPFTYLDFPGKLAAIAWFVGCNLRCMYCYNSDIVFAKEGRYTTDDLVAFLQTRHGLLDGVVLSGGEPTLHDLIPLCRRLKGMGFSVKLDTNGLHPETVKSLVEEKLLDYIALDFKATYHKFGFVTGSSRYRQFLETLDFLIASSVDFEVRTTVHADLLPPEEINNMIRELHDRGYRNTYFLQDFVPTDHSIADIEPPSQPFDKSRIVDLLPIEWR